MVVALTGCICLDELPKYSGNVVWMFSIHIGVVVFGVSAGLLLSAMFVELRLPSETASLILQQRLRDGLLIKICSQFTCRGTIIFSQPSYRIFLVRGLLFSVAEVILRGLFAFVVNGRQCSYQARTLKPCFSL
jgi:hypothetical protein